jgi:LmbE family N-acetylglucosaminyl deacetylase
MAAQRKREAEDAINILQIQRLEWVGLPEGAWAAATLEQALRKILTDQSPDILYAPSKIDFHPEHVKVAHALALALHAHPNPPRLIRVYQIQVPLTAVLTNLVADVSALASRCDAALRAYVSQAGAVRSAHRLRVYAAKRHHCAYQAEEFWQISVAHYIRLHRLEAPQRITAFRGLRHFPLTDPIAYLKGRKHRRDCLEPQQPSM